MFFLGHSHIASIERAARAGGVAYRSLNLWGFGRPVLYDGGPVRLNPELEQMLHEEVISAVGGSAHDMIGLAQHPRPFDFVLPEAPDLPFVEAAEVVPYAAIRAAIRIKMEDEQLDLLRVLAQSGRRVVHVESPPPLGHDERLVRQMADMPFVPKPHQGPSTPWLRYKLWRAHSAIWREACEQSGVVFAPYPKAATVDGAFLRPEFYERPCHANEGYGELVLRELGILA